MTQVSTGRNRGVGARLGWPLKLFVGALLLLLILIILNAFALNNETESAELTVPGATLVPTTSGQLQVLDTGADSQPGQLPVVLIHGSAGAINWWDDLGPLLEASRRVIAIDLLGYGGSDKPDSDYSIETQANLVAQVLAALKIPRAVLVGHSLGGKVVTSLEEQSPELVAGLVLIDSAPDDSFGELSGAAKASRVPLLGQALWRISPDFMVRRNLEQAFAPGFDVPDRFIADVRAMTYPAYRESGTKGDEFTDQASLVDRLAGSGKPLLVIFGSEDQIFDARESISAYAAIPGVKTLLIPGVGHSPQVEAPDQTAEAIAAFADSVTADQRSEAMAKRQATVAKRRAGKKKQQPTGGANQAKRPGQAGSSRTKQPGKGQAPGTGGRPSAKEQARIDREKAAAVTESP